MGNTIVSFWQNPQVWHKYVGDEPNNISHNLNALKSDIFLNV